MGTVIRRRDFSAAIEHVQQGIFLLAPKVTIPVTSLDINIGLTLSERVYKAKEDGRLISIENELSVVLDDEHRDVTLANPDILFSPEHDLEVIKLLLQVGRNKRLYMPWPGEICGELLTYSVRGRFDFKEYNIKNYVDTYIVLR